MEIFQDGAFPNLEYHLFQVINAETPNPLKQVIFQVEKRHILEYFHEIQLDVSKYTKYQN